MKSILELPKTALWSFPASNLTWKLTEPEIMHMYDAKAAIWLYDYEAALEGRKGLHARLKSKFCSDGFFFSKPVLDVKNFLLMIAKSMIWNYFEIHERTPDYVAAIPTGATELGRVIAELLGVPFIEIDKVSAKEFKLVTKVREGRNVWIIDDVCTKATALGMVEPLLFDVGLNIVDIQVILTRGRLTEIVIEDEARGKRRYGLSWLMKRDMSEWDCPHIHSNRGRQLANPCILCADGSKPIYPKRNDRTWEALTTSQLLLAA